MNNLPDPAALAHLHARCFARPRPWSEAEFTAMLGTRGTFLLARQSGFLLGRALAGEAELLTLAVDPDARRAGTGRALTAEFADTARAAGATDAFLEVAADNAAARALYAAQGWLEAGLRRGYYGPGADAVVMRLALGADQEGS